MKVEVRRVNTFNLRNLLGHDVPESEVFRHRDCLIRSSVIWLGLADGVEACAVGVIPSHLLSDDPPYLWLIYTKICEQHPVRFIRWSRRVMDEVLELYPSVVGLCDVNNEHGYGWLRWLGAHFDGSTSGNYMGFRINR